MRERPILFSGPMVRTILEGRKTQTRRVVIPQPTVGEKGLTTWRDIQLSASAFAMFAGPKMIEHCPYGKPGDRLWVRETWGCSSIYDSLPPRDVPKCGVAYQASGGMLGVKVRPSIFMPRWASRITLEICDVRVQRVQEISEEDAQAEGAERVRYLKDPFKTGALNARFSGELSTYKDAFRGLWDSINESRGFGWDANPWVWAISFRRADQ